VDNLNSIPVQPTHPDLSQFLVPSPENLFWITYCQHSWLKFILWEFT